MTQPHVLFEDLVPYEVPSSLDALRGPTSGAVTLPLHVWWGASRTFNLHDRIDRTTAYRALVREGRAADQEALLDRRLLLEIWRELRLPVRCRTTWESTFPELRR